MYFWSGKRDVLPNVTGISEGTVLPNVGERDTLREGCLTQSG